MSSHKEGWVTRPAKGSPVVTLILTSGLTVCKIRTEFPFVKSCLPRASNRQDAAPLISTTSCRAGRRQVLPRPLSWAGLPFAFELHAFHVVLREPQGATSALSTAQEKETKSDS